jgi:hypothetical protein
MERPPRSGRGGNPQPRLVSGFMSEPKKYTGGCHCGRVRFEVTLDLAEPAITCNCSICNRSGTVLRFVPSSAFELLSGADALTDYRFNNKVINHHFCRVCGIKSFASGVAPGGAETRAINVRCLDGVDLSSIVTHAYDGKSK